jgi:TPR repeat protein
MSTADLAGQAGLAPKTSFLRNPQMKKTKTVLNINDPADMAVLCLAAEQGDAQAQLNLGVAYYSGEGLARDEAEAVKWFRQAAEQGEAKAQFSLGLAYIFGFGVTKDKFEAIKWFRLAAEQGYARAQNCLGYAYEHGRGVAADKAEAVKWYRLAAEQGYAEDQNCQGYAYERPEAIKWAAQQGYLEAMEWWRQNSRNSRKKRPG